MPAKKKPNTPKATPCRWEWLPDNSGFRFWNGVTVQFCQRGTHPKVCGLPWIVLLRKGEKVEWRGIYQIPVIQQTDGKFAVSAKTLESWANTEAETEKPGVFLEGLCPSRSCLASASGENGVVIDAEVMKKYLQEPPPASEDILAHSLPGAEINSDQPSLEDCISGKSSNFRLHHQVHKKSGLILTNRSTKTLGELLALTDKTIPSQKARERRNAIVWNRLLVFKALNDVWKRRDALNPPTTFEVVTEYRNRPSDTVTVESKRARKILAELGFDWLPQEGSHAEFRWDRDQMSSRVGGI